MDDLSSSESDSDSANDDIDYEVIGDKEGKEAKVAWSSILTEIGLDGSAETDALSKERKHRKQRKPMEKPMGWETTNGLPLRTTCVAAFSFAVTVYGKIEVKLKCSTVQSDNIENTSLLVIFSFLNLKIIPNFF